MELQDCGLSVLAPGRQSVATDGWEGEQAAAPIGKLQVTEETSGKTKPNQFPLTMLLLGIMCEFNE